MQETVDLWNENNPDIQVDYKEVVGGNQGTYQAYFNQIKAGKTPDIGMVEFDNLPSFRLQDGLQNVGGCQPVKDVEGKYVDWAISQVGFGEEGAVYGIPMDIGPMALYYRKDLFDEAGIPVPDDVGRVLRGRARRSRPRAPPSATSRPTSRRGSPRWPGRTARSGSPSTTTPGP